jgi:hypothetical protein
MNTECLPINTKGSRNVFCPHYSDCLDYVITKSWKNWNCNKCEHRQARDPMIDIPLTVGEISYYDLPLDIYRQIW